MITLREYLSTGSLWTEINNIWNFDFINDGMRSPEQLDLLTKVNYGERFLIEDFENISIPDIAYIISSTFNEKWRNLIETELDKINLKSSNQTVTISSNNSTSDKTNVTDNINKVTAYNESDLINDSGSSNEVIDNEIVVNNKNSNIGNENIQNLIINLNDYQKANILNVAIKDVAQFLTLSIY
mgnify:CR=1 FL=1